MDNNLYMCVDKPVLPKEESYGNCYITYSVFTNQSGPLAYKLESVFLFSKASLVYSYHQLAITQVSSNQGRIWKEIKDTYIRTETFQLQPGCVTHWLSRLLAKHCIFCT